jgi:folylpolyglutamate synthase/dihydropteroate synthase
MLAAMDVARARLLVACPPPSPRALDPAAVADAAGAMGLPAEMATSVAEAVTYALARADPDDVVVITGSLYVVGAARAVLAGAAG